ncbi:hypothetical protein DIZ76_015006 [Coccidioides immitis]|nr:hypothetical protein DIZ76_015006 [Coccidioides immitis]
MDERQKLTVASTWKFNPQAILEIRDNLKNIEDTGISCRYEQPGDVFIVDSSGTAEKISALGQLLASFIDEEKDNDLLERPKITRIVAPPSMEERGFESSSENDEASLMETPSDVQEEIPMSLPGKHWESKAGGVECFLRLPYDVLAEVADATGAHIDLEAENKRIRVASIVPARVEDAVHKLDNLDRAISLATSSHVENMLHVTDSKDFTLRLRTYASLNHLALRRLLVDPRVKGATQFEKMYATVIEFPNSENKTSEMPKNIAAPPRPTLLRKGRPTIWSDFLFAELGDVDNLPDTPSTAEATTRHGAQCYQTYSAPRITLSEETEGDKHPFLSREKVSLVDKWVADGFEAGVVGPSCSGPNILRAYDSSPEPTPPLLAAPGLKKRVAMVTSSAGSLHQTREPHSFGVKAPMPVSIGSNLTGAEASQPNLSTTQCELNAQSNALRSSKTKVSELIDTSYASDTIAAAVPTLAFDQAPLVPACPSQATFSPDKPDLPNAALINNSVPLPTSSELVIISHMTGTERRDSTLSSFNLETSFRFLNPDLGLQGAGFLQRPIQSQNVERPGQDLAKIADGNKEGHSLDNPDQNVGGVQRRCSRSKCEMLSSDHIVERLQPVSEVETRVFCKIMRQHSSNIGSGRSSKASRKAKKKAAIAEAWGAPVPTGRSASAKRAESPEYSKWQREQLAEPRASENNRIADLYTALNPLLAAAQCFSGIVSLEIQFGLILIHNVPKIYVDKAIDVKTWEKLFRPQHGLRGPGTKFMNLLTSSGADIDYMLDLKNDSRHSLFSRNPSVRFVSYEFHCQTKNNQPIVINVNETGMTVVTRPEIVLGAVNVHFPQQIWDMRVVIKGAQEYAPGVDKEIDCAVEALISNLYVYPGRAKVLLFTRLDNFDILHITKVFMRRTTRHRCLEDVRNVKYNPQAQPWSENHCNLPSNMTSASSSERGLYLQITEVQNLLLGRMATDKTLIRARALSPDEMVDNSRLWYEACIVSPAVDKVLESNRSLPVGACVWDWQPADLMGIDANIMTEYPSETKRRVGSNGLASMYRVASQVPVHIDGVGWANSWPTAEARTSFPASSATAASNLAVAADPNVGIAEPLRDMEGRMLQEGVDCLESISGRDTGDVGEFW